jgi:hypothetical protein
MKAVSSNLKTRSEYALAMGLSREPRSLLGTTTEHENDQRIPSWEGQGPSAPAVGFGAYDGPTPGASRPLSLRATPEAVKKFNNKDTLRRVRDGKPNTDAEHRVPTRSRSYDQPNCFTASLTGGGFQETVR